jgi:hypothetical protein
MTQSTLRQVLTMFETAVTPLSLPQMAHELGVSLEQLEGMIQYWVRKGKIRESAAATECGSCGSKDGCAFVMEMPRTFELARSAEAISLPLVGVTCGQQTKK